MCVCVEVFAAFGYVLVVLFVLVLCCCLMCDCVSYC